MNAYTYNDVLIEPQYSEVLSRTDVDLSTDIGNVHLRLPVISSNMRTITGPKMASTIAACGGMGLLHRFCTIDENIQMFQDAKAGLFKPEMLRPHLSPEELIKKWAPVLENKTNGDPKTAILIESQERWIYDPIGVSIGVKEEDKERFEKLYEAGARIFCIDVAHGHHIHVKKMLHWINNEIALWDRSLRGQLCIIAGNIATADGYKDIQDWGADAVKVGLGPSPVCRTRYNTGVGVPQLYALEMVYKASTLYPNPISIIADGGITHVGDISKALKYADAVMVGSMIAGTSETPGNVFRNEDGDFYKVYGGSASGENKGSNHFVEGVIKPVKFKGKVKYIFHEIEQGLQSAFSYVGADNLAKYQQKCKFVHISGGAQGESKI